VLPGTSTDRLSGSPQNNAKLQSYSDPLPAEVRFMSASGEGIDLRSVDADPAGSLLAPLASRRTLVAEYLAAFRQMRLDDALALAGLGAPMHAITLPIPAQLKCSILKDWPNRQFEIAHLDPERNFAIRLGQRSGDLVDADLDYEGAIEIRPHLFAADRRNVRAKIKAALQLAVGFAPEPQQPTPSKIPATLLPHEADDWLTRIARRSSGRRLRGAQS
jgi:hypothetical protein